jgi:RNA recognition motif-containing protein
MNIYVGNVSWDMSNDELSRIFSEFGEVTNANIITDRNTGRSKGFGFVEMSDDNAAKAAIDALNGTEINGRNAVVNEARPREERPRRNDY